MTDFDPFERRLAAALRSDADLIVARFEPAAIARAAIAGARPGSFRSRIGTAVAFGRPTIRVSYLLVVLGLVLALVVGAIAAGALRTRPMAPSGWTATGAMIQARTWHTATLLPNGRVLVVGGGNGDSTFDSAELYDPTTRSWTATGSMAQGRQDHTATLLRDGRVLVAGGSDAKGATVASAELYDPGTGSWAATGSMAQPSARHTATLLPDGKVLVVGGSSAELYDPGTGTWARTGGLIQPRVGHSATLLEDGRILVVGGFTDGAALASAELFDPESGSWTATGSMGTGRAGHTATLLPSRGRVLVAGGTTGPGSFQPTASVELYDPITNESWMRTWPMDQARVYATVTVLPDGRVLVAGGSGATSSGDPVGPAAPAELFDPSSGWSATGRMIEARSYATATLLQDGTVLVAGGRTRPVLGSALASAELYDPGTGTR